MWSIRQSHVNARLRVSHSLSMIYLRTADNQTVVFAVIKSSCGHWRDVIGVVCKSERRKAKAKFERRNNGGSYRGRDTIGRPHVGICGFDGMIQGWTDRDQHCDQALMRVPRKHAKSARLITRSGLVRSCQATWSTDALQCRKSMQLDVRLFIDNHWFIDGQITYEPIKENFIYRCRKDEKNWQWITKTVFDEEIMDSSWKIQDVSHCMEVIYDQRYRFPLNLCYLSHAKSIILS